MVVVVALVALGSTALVGPGVPEGVFFRCFAAAACGAAASKRARMFAAAFASATQK